jgi:uncharacterized protein YkwD
MNPMRLRRSVLAAAIATAAVTLPAVPTAAAQGVCRHADEVPTSVAGARSATLCLLNAQRSRHGLSPLSSQGRLQRAATAYSRKMVTQHFFDHVGPDGSTLQQRIASAGYGGWSTIGENIAWGSGRLATPATIVTEWMHSPGHRANILRPAFRQIGIGIATGAPLRVSGAAAVYTTDFARPL